MGVQENSLYRAMKHLRLLMRPQRKKKHHAQPYDTPKVAGARVQIDVKYVPKACYAAGLPQSYQFTAVDECTRLRFRYVFEELSSYNTALFLKMVQQYYPFEVQCVQADNGIEFMNTLCGTDKLSVLE